MTFNEIEKEFDEQFHDREMWFGDDVQGIDDTKEIKSFLKQSFIKYLQSEVDRLEGLDVSCIDDRLLGRSDEYLEGYNTSTDRWREQRDNQITHINNQIKELEVN